MPPKAIVGDKAAQAERRAAREERAKLRETIQELGNIEARLQAIEGRMTILAESLTAATFNTANATQGDKINALRVALKDLAGDMGNTARQTVQVSNKVQAGLRILKEE